MVRRFFFAIRRPHLRQVFALLIWLIPTFAAAQPVTVLRVDFEFSNPGARSLGLGGAFAALADDATAAYANPAGLAQLVEQEVSLELRSWNRSVPYLAGGRVDGMPTGIGLDVEPMPVERIGGEDVTDISFLSYVRPKRRWSFALFHHQLARFEIETEAQGQFFDILPGVPFRFPASRERLEIDLTATGTAASWKLSETLSVGLAMSYIESNSRAQSELFSPFDGTPESLFEPASFQPEELIARQDTRVEDSTITGRFGVLWQPTERWSTAAFFRQGAELEGRLIRQSTPLGGEEETAETLPTELLVPDVMGLGVAYRALEGKLTVGLEVDFIDALPLFRAEEEEGDSFGLEEYHLGGEYAFLKGRRLMAWRGGVWYDSRPQGLLQSSGTMHYAIGFGIATNRLQFDIAADFSNAVDTFSISTIYSF